MVIFEGGYPGSCSETQKTSRSYLQCGLQNARNDRKVPDTGTGRGFKSAHTLFLKLYLKKKHFVAQTGLELAQKPLAPSQVQTDELKEWF